MANILLVRFRVFCVFVSYKKSFKDVQPALLKSIQFIYSLALWEAKYEYEAKDWLEVTEF